MHLLYYTNVKKEVCLFPSFPIGSVHWDFRKMFSQNSCGSDGVEQSSHEEKWHVEMCCSHFIM